MTFTLTFTYLSVLFEILAVGILNNHNIYVKTFWGVPYCLYLAFLARVLNVS